MSSRYERNRDKREASRQRSLMGETLAQFHERENPTRQAIGSHLPRVRCNRTPNLFREQITREEFVELFSEPELDEPPAQGSLL